MLLNFVPQNLKYTRARGLFGKDVVLITLEDPKGGVGSGGATLNALLVVTEHLSAKAGFRVSININGYEFFLKTLLKKLLP